MHVHRGRAEFAFLAMSRVLAAWKPVFEKLSTAASRMRRDRRAFDTAIEQVGEIPNHTSGIDR